MIEHSPTAFIHREFIMNIIKVTNYDLYYRSVQFYLDEQPMQLNELLNSMSKASKNIDLGKCIAVVKNNGYLALIKDFLMSV
jgi:clathrin heavy chain